MYRHPNCGAGMPALAFDFLCSVFKERCRGEHMAPRNQRCTFTMLGSYRQDRPFRGPPIGRVAAFGGGFRSYRTVSSVSSGLSLLALVPGSGALLMRRITLPAPSRKRHSGRAQVLPPHPTLSGSPTGASDRARRGVA
jgi:hypothetical protein